MLDHVLELEPLSSLPADVGDVIGGKYVVGQCISWGGMGVVLEATHIELDTPVAVKCLRVELATDEDVARRFLNEARAAARLRNEHVARVIDFGRMPNGAPYMVMERLHGADLADILAQRGALPLTEAVGYVLQTAEGLAEAHARGIVHRDIKPENLFVSRAVDGLPVVKILDFGISLQLELQGRSLTNPAQSIGSPCYMPPEQMRNAHDTDARSDIWSLGVVLFELLTGRPPFGGTTVPEICASVLTDPPRSLTELRPDLPPQIEAVVRHCLQKDRYSRFQDVLELAAALAPWGPDRAEDSVSSIQRMVVGGASAPPPASLASSESLSPSAGAITHIPGVHARWPYAVTLCVLAIAGGVLVAERLGYDLRAQLPVLTPGLAHDAPAEPDNATIRTFQARAALPLLAILHGEPEPPPATASAPPRVAHAWRPVRGHATRITPSATPSSSAAAPPPDAGVPLDDLLPVPFQPAGP